MELRAQGGWISLEETVIMNISYNWTNLKAHLSFCIVVLENAYKCVLLCLVLTEISGQYAISRNIHIKHDN